MIQVGGMFRLRMDGAENGHPRIILSEPHHETKLVLVANFTDAENDFDSSCIFSREDIRVLHKPSVIAMNHLVDLCPKKLEQAVGTRVEILEPCPMPALLRILDYVTTHPDLMPKHRKYLQS